MVEEPNIPEESPAGALTDMNAPEPPLPRWLRDPEPVAAEGLPPWLNVPLPEPAMGGPPLLEVKALSPQSSPPLPSPQDPVSDPEIDLFAKPAEDASFLNLSAVYVRDLLKTSSKYPAPGSAHECPTSSLDPVGEEKGPAAGPIVRLVDGSEKSREKAKEDSHDRDETSTSSVQMERQPPLSRLMRPVVYGIEVPNTGTKPLFQVRVEHELPAGFRFLGAEPAPEVRGNKLVWKLGDLEPSSVKRILVRVQSKQTGKLLPESATTFRTAYGVRTRITKPRLQATVTGPQSVGKGEPAAFDIQVSNSGSGQATNVVVRNQLSSGLLHEQGHLVAVDFGTLSPGESVKLSLRTLAQEAGPQVNEVVVSGTECVSVAAQANLLVTQPELALQITGPADLHPNQETDYLVAASNTGTAAASNIEVCYTLPEGLEFVSADEHAVHDPGAHSVTWSFGSLAAGQDRLLPLRVIGRFPGDFIHQVKVRSTEGMEATAELSVSCDFEAAETSRILEELLAGIDRQVRPTRAPRRRASGIASQPAAAGKPEDQHIVFTLAGIDYAVPLAGVVEIGRTSNITLVPNVPEWVLGVANVRGDIVSMVDLATFFGLDRCDSTADSRLLVARSLSGEMATGLVVEKVKGIRFVSENRITAPPSTFENRLTPYMRGVAEIDGRLVVLLDLDRLLLSAEMRQVELV